MSKKHKEARKAQRQSLYTPEENTQVNEKQEVQETVEQAEVKEEAPINVITEEVVAENVAETTEGVIVTEDKAEEKKDKKSKKDENAKQDSKDAKKDNKKKGKKDNKKSLIKKTKETASELKKVTWPTFGEVVKKTGIVIAFVVIFGLLIYGVDVLLGWLVSLLV